MANATRVVLTGLSVKRHRTKLFGLAGVAKGQRNAVFHRLRDTFAVGLLLARVPIERVSILRGHITTRGCARGRSSLRPISPETGRAIRCSCKKYWVQNGYRFTRGSGKPMKTKTKFWRRGWDSNPAALLTTRKLLIDSANLAMTSKFARFGYSLRTVALALLLCADAATAQGPSRSFRVPFHTVNGMVLLDAEVNGKPAVLLLDTGADFTLISPQASGLPKARLRALTATQTTGANGEYVKARVDLKLAEQRWVDRAVLVMDLSEASKRLGTRIDGFVGADLLQEFSAVRIDFRNHLVELESER